MYFQDGYRELAFAEIAMKNIDVMVKQIKEFEPQFEWMNENLTNFEILEKLMNSEDCMEDVNFRSRFPNNIPTKTIISACKSSLKKLENIALAGKTKLRNYNLLIIPILFFRQNNKLGAGEI